MIAYCHIRSTCSIRTSPAINIDRVAHYTGIRSGDTRMVFGAAIPGWYNQHVVVSLQHLLISFQTHVIHLHRRSLASMLLHHHYLPPPFTATPYRYSLPGQYCR
jgi:hypothetical protein